MKKIQSYLTLLSLLLFSLPIFGADDQPVLPETLEAALNIVDNLEGYSCDYSWGIYFDDTRDDQHYLQWLDALSNHRHPTVQAMAPIMIELVHHLYRQGHQLSHVAIRIDPDTTRMFRVRNGFPNNRGTSHRWHRHDTDNFIYTLSRTLETSTQIREEEDYPVPLQTLFLLRGDMLHRTPPQTTERYRRIHFTFGIRPVIEKENLLPVVAPSEGEPPSKRRKLDDMFNRNPVKIPFNFGSL